MSLDSRRARRVLLNVPVLVESIGQQDVNLHPNLAAVYTRVSADAEKSGVRFPGAVRDLSTNGAFVAGDPLPLLSRVTLKFDLQGFGAIEAIGWVLWRRAADCEIPGPSGRMVTLPRGFGVLFEALPLEARAAIAKMVTQN